MQDLDALQKVMRLLSERGVQMNLEVYGVIIAAAAKCTSSSSSEACLAVGKQAWQQMKLDSYEPRGGHLGAALSLCANAGDPNWARQLWLELPKPSITQLTSYLVALAAHEAPSLTWSTIFAEICKAKVSGPYPTEFLLAELLNVAAKQRDSKTAQRLWQELSKFNVCKLRPETFHAFAKALLLGGDPAGVRPLTKDMLHVGVPPNFRNFLCEAQALLLLLHESPARQTARQELCRSLDEGLQRATAEKRSSKDFALMKAIRRLADVIEGGESIPVSQIRILWPGKWA
ncbi:unnamed protein product [Polarella glacialis]|uniref:Uncharacterized protein n=1 Tax=Polarella glacialis TaxID=89957 RepID=A0A813GSS3_POLGL|nr:unnamed protein product [Polarella glacialis]